MRSLRTAWLVVLSFSLLLAARTSSAQNNTGGEKDPDLVALADRVEQLLDSVDLSRKDLEGALDELVKGSPLASRAEAIKRLTEEALELKDKDKYGVYKEFEQIDARRVGKDLVFLLYLYKCEKFPVVWYFTFYRDFKQSAVDGNKWVLIAVRFDTKLDPLRVYGRTTREGGNAP